MASKSEQINRADSAKITTARAIGRALDPWIDSVAADYRPGAFGISEENKLMLKVIVRQQLDLGAKRILGFDYRQYKTVDQDVYELIASSMADAITLYAAMSTASVIRTAEDHIARANTVLADPKLGPPAARPTLKNLLKSQRLVIGLTNSEWVTETGRMITVRAVTDPMKNTVEQIALLIEQGDNNGAVRLSREVVALAKLPLSVSQGETIRMLNETVNVIAPGLYTPIVQGEAVVNLRRQAAKLGATMKQWVTIGDGHVRSSHVAAGGQTKPVDEPFELEGGLLQYPGDGSLGASLGETINCRCATAYI